MKMNPGMMWMIVRTGKLCRPLSNGNLGEMSHLPKPAIIPMRRRTSSTPMTVSVQVPAHSKFRKVFTI